ncbi:MAG TPA: hypothetical protein DDY98_08215, partial [Ruminococcaceae bacterium]|nr:hypothetical protein [Oscillospiraceae bacterium]
RKHAVFFQDILFWTVSAFLTVLFLLVVNHGSLRFYIFSAAVLGFFIYYFTLSRIVLRAGDLVFSSIRKIIFVLSHILCAPMRLFLRVFAFFRRKARKKRKNNEKKS